MAKLIIFIFILLFGIAYSVSWVNGHLPDQKTFEAAKTPDPDLDGNYYLIAFLTGDWKGMHFDANASTGVNLVRDNGQTVKKYPFKTYTGKDLVNTSKDVLKIDVDQPGNPFWMKFIQAEVVQAGDNKYIGKIYLTLIPSIPFNLLFFHMEEGL